AFGSKPKVRQLQRGLSYDRKHHKHSDGAAAACHANKPQHRGRAHLPPLSTLRTLRCRRRPVADPPSETFALVHRLQRQHSAHASAHTTNARRPCASSSHAARPVAETCPPSHV